MLEKTGDIWKTDRDVMAITTNGVVKNNGELVMGKGIALQAKRRYPGLPKAMGDFVSTIGCGNIPEIFYCGADVGKLVTLVSLPTKHHWRDKSDISLIKKSLIIIEDIIPKSQTIALTRPGCGNGGLNWETEVKPIIEPLLNDRFTIYEYRPC